MKNLFRLILGAHIAVFGIQLTIDTAAAQTLRPGSDAVITPGGRTIVNPPARTSRATPRPTRNPDGSTTYPRGTTPPRTDGFTQANSDGSVTIFPRGGTRTPPPPRPTRQPPRTRPGDDAVITPGGRTILNPPLPNPRRTTQSPRIRPGDDAVITPGGRTILNPQPGSQAGGIPRPTSQLQPQSQPKTESPTSVRRIGFDKMVTRDGRRFDPQSLGTGRVGVMSPATNR